MGGANIDTETSNTYSHGLARAEARNRRYRRRVLAVRAMAGETAWLDGKIVWLDGRVAWESDRGTTVPSVQEIAIAQRRLNQIASYPYASAQALGDAPAWLSRRFARLELAKYLSSLHAPDLASLVARARAGSVEASRKLVPLLAVEALCINELPAAPSPALVTAGHNAEEGLLGYLKAGEAPLAGRAMAALVLGAVRRQGGALVSGSEMPPALAGSEWLRRAYAYGLKWGLPNDPSITLGLLASEEGDRLAARYTAIARAPGPFSLPAVMVREMLFAGTPPATLIDTMEALRTATPLAERIMDYRGELPDTGTLRKGKKWVRESERHEEATKLYAERKQVLDDVTGVIHCYVGVAPGAEIVYGLVTFCNLALDVDTLSPRLGAYMTNQLRAGLQLPASALGLYLELLALKQEKWRDKDEWPEWMKSLSFSNALDRLELLLGKSTARMLQNCGDPGIVRRVTELGLEFVLEENRWSDYELYRWALSLIEEFGLIRSTWTSGKICYLLGIFPTARAARAALQPFFASIMQAPRDLRADICINLLEEIDQNRKSASQAVPRLARYVPAFIAFVRAHRALASFLAPLDKVAIALDTAVPGEAHTWLGWLLQHLSSFDDERQITWLQVQAVRLGGLLAVAVSGGDLRRFQSVARVGLRSEFDYQSHVLEDAISNLRRFPGAHAPVADMFPRQPRRCLELIVRLDLAQRLGPQSTQPIAVLENSTDDIEPQAEEASPEWRALLEIAPGLQLAVRQYIHSRKIRGESTQMPPGVRDMVSQRSKLAKELAFIEAKLQAQPTRADLASRARNLRERLQDQKKHTRSIVEEAGERLKQVTAEAQLAAAEHLVMACYREHLDMVAGPVPDDLQLDENLVNAILLTVDIKQNKRLLRALLRAYIRGERRWPETQPLNVQFLDSLNARGVNVAAWLGKHPRRFTFKGAHEGYVHLSLERDPLHVLQMGNYFDTCLSFGGINAFSTVANATELNKRVIYARDGKGRVIGRKLIAINEQGALVGFRTYTNLGWKEGGRELSVIFRRYATTFAQACGLQMQAEGNVPHLLTRHWYDDGITDWYEDTDAAPENRSNSSQEPHLRTRSPRVRRIRKR